LHANANRAVVSMRVDASCAFIGCCH
jgi:hypothetical protein